MQPDFHTSPDRRRFLRQSALFPLLPALLAGQRGQTAPARLLYVYVPNGVWLPDFRPAALGELGELPASLAPLAPWRSRLLALSGFSADKARANGDGPGDHARAAASFLTGVQAKKTSGEVQLGPSADQLLARAIGSATLLPSLCLGTEESLTSGECDSGYACAYSSHVSWRDERSPAPKDSDPRRLFERLFRGGGGLTADRRRERDLRRRKVLDLLWSQSKGLLTQLSGADRERAEPVLAGLAELERQLEQGGDDFQQVPDSSRPPEPIDYDSRARGLIQVLALAFATDRTRVATLMLGNEGSNRPYPNLSEPEGHHSLSHYGEDPDKQRRIARINRYHIELLAELLRQLESFQLGSGTLLDQVQIVYGSGIADGNKHDHGDLPLLLIGNPPAGGRPRPLGRHLRMPSETPLNDLHLTLLADFGVAPEAFGDGRGALDLGLAEGA
jgi:hypothetical protein